MKVVLLVMILSLIQGCATSNISKDFELRPDSRKGLVFGSITTDIKSGGENVVALFYVKSADNESHYFESRQEVIPGLTLSQSEFDEVSGRLFATALNPGTYQLHNWQLKQGNIFLRPNDNPQPLEFEVVEGEIAYLGNWHINFTVGDWFLSKAINGAVPEIRDLSERDLNLLNVNYPQFQDREIHNEVPQLGVWANQSSEREVIVPMPITIQ